MPRRRAKVTPNYTIDSKGNPVPNATRIRIEFIKFEIREAEGLAAFATDPTAARKLLDDLREELRKLEAPPR